MIEQVNNIETNTNSWDFVVYLICIKDCCKVKWQKHGKSWDLIGEGRRSYEKSKDKHNKHYAKGKVERQNTIEQNKTTIKHKHTHTHKERKIAKIFIYFFIENKKKTLF